MRYLGIGLLAVALLVGIYLLVDRLVVTDEERIEALVARGAEAASARSVERCVALAHPGCRVEGAAADTLPEACAAIFREFRELSVAVDGVEFVAVDRAGGVARAVVRASVTPVFADLGAAGTFVTTFEAAFARTAEAWLVTSLKHLKTESAFQEALGGGK